MKTKANKPLVTMKRTIILLFLILVIPTLSHAQGATKDTIKDTTKHPAKRFYNTGQFLHESFLFAKQPTVWKGADWLRLGAITAVAISVMPFDQHISTLTEGKQQYYYSVPIVAGRVYGEWYSIGTVTAAFAIYGIANHDTAAKKISIELLQSGVFAEAMTYVLKVGIGRARPIAGLGPFFYKPGSFFNYDLNSMPSGHMTSAMALSTVMSRHARTTFLKILAYAPAAFTLVSRIYQGQHWLSDEIMGGAFGYFTGVWVVNLHEGKKHKIVIPTPENPK